MTCLQGYLLIIPAKMGTFPLSGGDHNKPAIGRLLKGARNNELANIEGLSDLADKL